MDMSGKTCLVTGANAGIGKWTAQGLADLGATVVMLCRDRARGEAALAETRRNSRTESVSLMLCDLASQSSIRAFANEFKSRYPRLDVLVNNAGVYVRRQTLTEDGIEVTFAVNHLAYFLLTDLLLDVLKKSSPSRIINVASGAHAYGSIDFEDLQNLRNYGGVNAYADSKLANLLFTFELARRL
jgi:NAD(P)-dependent dehydrogenase (short-subunit alcohol dehydrogenase family)